MKLSLNALDWLESFEIKNIPKYIGHKYCCVWILGQTHKVEYTNNLIEIAREKFNSNDGLYLFLYDLENDYEVKLIITDVETHKYE